MLKVATVATIETDNYVWKLRPNGGWTYSRKDDALFLGGVGAGTATAELLNSIVENSK